jgi:hypothetical protein
VSDWSRRLPIMQRRSLLVMRYCKDFTTGGVLELLRGVLGGGDRILEIAVEAAKTPEAIHGIRNLIIMLKLAGSIDPDQLHAALDVGHKKAPSLWEIGKRARTDDARRGIETAVALFGIFGAALNEEQRAKNN